jgi:hypothetical protein
MNGRGSRLQKTMAATSRFFRLTVLAWAGRKGFLTATSPRRNCSMNQAP